MTLVTIISVFSIVLSVCSVAFTAYMCGLLNKRLTPEKKKEKEDFQFFKKAHKFKYMLHVHSYRVAKIRAEKSNLKRISNSGTQKFLIFVVAIITAFVIAANAICMLCVCCPDIVSSVFPNIGINFVLDVEMDDSAKIDTVFISTGLNVVAIAIAVWSGLHIIQVLEKNQFEEAKKTLARLNAEVETSNAERRETSYKTLLSSVEALGSRGGKDLLNICLLGILSEMDYRSLPADFLFDLSRIEASFQRLYQKHYEDSDITADEYEAIMFLIDDIQSRIVDTISKSSKQNKTIQKYLNLRIAEINFYYGYNCKAHLVSDVYETAINYYLEVFPDFKDTQKLQNKLKNSKDNIEFDVYMINTLAEAYSKILHRAKPVLSNNAYTDYMNICKTYSEILTDVLSANKNNISIHREVYYRNIGCFWERYYGISGGTHAPAEKEYNQIIPFYLKSLEIGLAKKDLNESQFYVFFSLHHKYYDGLFRISNHSGKVKSFPIPPFSSNPDADKLLRQLSQCSAYMRIALNFSKNPMYYLEQQAFLYRDYHVVYCWKGCDAEANDYLEKMEQAIDELLTIQAKRDDFTYQLCKQYDDLTSSKKYGHVYANADK